MSPGAGCGPAHVINQILHTAHCINAPRNWNTDMYAVIQTGGKQYRVAVGDRLRVESINAEENDTVAFSEVLAIGGDDGMQVGSPHLDTTVEAKVLGNGRGKKIQVIKFKRRKNYRRNRGHRQAFTEVEITAIGGNTTSAKKPEPAAEPANAPAPAPAAAAAPAPAQDADDLTKINGIGPIIRDQLVERGITTFAQIAAFSPEDVDRVNEDLSFPGRIEREEWVEQAKALVDG